MLQETKHDFIEQNSIEFQSTPSCNKLTASESNIRINITSMNDFNMYDDPPNWPISISQNIRTGIVKLVFKRILNFKFPSRLITSSSSEKENYRRFSTEFYYRKLFNGERVNRNRLVYSISTDRVFCFC